MIYNIVRSLKITLTSINTPISYGATYITVILVFLGPEWVHDNVMTKIWFLPVVLMTYLSIHLVNQKEYIAHFFHALVCHASFHGYTINKNINSVTMEKNKLDNPMIIGKTISSTISFCLIFSLFLNIVYPPYQKIREQESIEKKLNLLETRIKKLESSA